MEERFYIGTLAERSGLGRDTIRYYERVGLLPAPERTPAGYRVYGESALDRLRFIRQARTLGLRLEEIAEVLRLADEGVEPCEHVKERLRGRLSEVEARIRALQALRRRLGAALERAVRAPAPGPCRCAIIEGVAPEGAGSRSGEDGSELSSAPGRA